MRNLKNTVITIIILLSISMSSAANSSETILEKSTKQLAVEYGNRSSFSDKKLNVIFTNYFLLKEDLVNTNGQLAAAKAKLLVASLINVKTTELSKEVQTVWMKVVKKITEDSKAIAATSDVKAQRVHFVSLSKKMYDLVKVAKYDSTVYYQYCPMANDGKGAYWLSIENAVRNPYYGSKMLKCGEVVETIK